MFKLWRVFYPVALNHHEEYNEIQPSYRTIRLRHLMLLQIRNKRPRLRRTFIVASFNNTTYRLPEINI